MEHKRKSREGAFTTSTGKELLSVEMCIERLCCHLVIKTQQDAEVSEGVGPICHLVTFVSWYFNCVAFE